MVTCKHLLRLPGCFEICPPVHADERGRLVKPFNRDWFATLDLPTDFAEDFYSVSQQGVIRGLHVQAPPMAHCKLVYCSDGCVWDVLLDLRGGSPTYGEHAALELCAETANMVYAPVGVAHGYCVLSAHACVHYKVSSVYSPTHETGIRWDSAGIDWPESAPVVSARDKALPLLGSFETPFLFDSGAARCAVP